RDESAGKAARAALPAELRQELAALGLL
ncbi:MAG TPA: DUF1489 domain-containing protein, partial [Ochrobactrum sp.]|nr:DUF1489 domain-containing protein [Ochrobactrum sp.]